MSYLVLDVGGSGIKFALADEHYRLLHKDTYATNYSSHEEFIDAIAEIRGRFGELAGIAISICGEVDPATGEMFTGGVLRFNAGRNVLRSVADRSGLPVSIENDANCALLAEAHDGALADCRHGMVIVLGTAVGGGILIDGEAYHGASFHSGNASYTRTDLDRPQSALLAKVGGVSALVAEYAGARGAPDNDGLTPELVFARVEQRDPAALQALQRYCSRLAAFIYNAHMLLDVEAVAIGGGISEQPALIITLREAVDRQFELAPIPLPRPEIRACRYRNDANLIGALHHHLHSSRAGVPAATPSGRA